ncbi:MAG: hypothetical protein Kow00122_20980 [Thermoleophilia bacterium]
MSASAPALAPDLERSLKRVRLARIRTIAPEVLLTATTQRWNPEEVLRTLVEAEIAPRDEANLRSREKQAGFPMLRTLDSFKVAESAVPEATFRHLASLE